MNEPFKPTTVMESGSMVSRQQLMHHMNTLC